MNKTTTFSLYVILVLEISICVSVERKHMSHFSIPLENVLPLTENKKNNIILTINKNNIF